MKPPQVPSSPGVHCSTEFHFHGGWSVEFIKIHGAGHAVSVELRRVGTEPDTVMDQLWEFPAHTANMPTQRNARGFCFRSLAEFERNESK